MAEIVNDIKVDLVEAVGSLGITLSSNNTRIRHTETGVFDISSNGAINISSSNEAVDIDIASISITSGSGKEGQNSDGGEFSLETGNGTGTGSGGQINIQSGFGILGNGGDIYIQAGGSSNIAQGGAEGGSISIITGNGATKCGDFNIQLGPDPGASIENITQFGPTGKFNIKYGAFKLAVFINEEARDLRIPIASREKGDMCFVNDKIHVYNGTAWRTLAFEP